MTMAAAAAPWPARADFESFPPPDREKMVPVEGGRIYVRQNGVIRAEKPPILFIHGGPGGTHVHYLTMLPLADERAVLMYDQLDSGLSDHPENPKNWRVERFVDEVDHIRRAFGLERLHVCGHSWGGTVALEYAACQPKGLASAILGSPLVSTRSWLADANKLRGDLPADTQQTLASCEATSTPPEPQCDAATDIFYAHYLQRTQGYPALVAYRDTLGGSNKKLYNAMWGRTEFISTGTLKDYDGEPLLAKLDGPRTLFVTGQFDEARPETIGGFARRVPGAEFAVMPGSGHAITVDRPHEYACLLRGWLGRHDA